MQPRKVEARTAPTVPSLSSEEDRPNPFNPQTDPDQAFCGWVEAEQLSDAGEFLDDWGNSIVELSSLPEMDERELRREATAWERAMHAYSNWRKAA